MEDTVYVRIAESVDRAPQGAPRVGVEFSKTFIAYLKLVYTGEEAEVVQYLNMPAERWLIPKNATPLETSRELWKTIAMENKGIRQQ